MSRNQKGWDQVLVAAEKQGLRVERPGTRRNADGSRKKGGKHIRVTNVETGRFVFVSNTPSDYRGIKNDIGWMRRELGFQWPVTEKVKECTEPPESR